MLLRPSCLLGSTGLSLCWCLAHNWMELLQSAFIAHMHAAFRGRAPYKDKKPENRGTPNKRERRE